MRPHDREAIMKLPDDDCQEYETAVVVTSCSAYSQVWRPFFMLFRRYWPDCPYPVYFLTDVEHCGIPNAPWMADTIGLYAEGNSPIFTYTEPNDLGWCANFVSLMRFVREKRVILFQEDFLLQSPVDTPVVRRLARYAWGNDVGCLRLAPCPGPDREWQHDPFGEIDVNADYRVSLQLAIWDKKLISGLAAKAGSPWRMEERGSELTRNSRQPFLSIHRESHHVMGPIPVPYFMTAVTRGKWEKGALELMRKEGIPMDGITERIP